MDLNVLKWQMLRGSLMRRLLLRAFAFGSVMLVVSVIHMANEIGKMEPLHVNFDECPLNFGSDPCHHFIDMLKPQSVFGFPLLWVFKMPCKESDNLAKNVFKELMEKNLLDSNANMLSVGEGSASAVLAMRELGFENAIGVNVHPFFSLLRRRFVYELDFADGYFDFVFSRALDRVSVPALLVLEIERVLRPGGIGAMLVGARDFYSGSLIRSATPVSSFLKSSDVVHVCGVGSYSLVIFKKRFEDVQFFEQYKLPKECPSITKNKPFMKFIEPLVHEKSTQMKREVLYLPKFMNISSRNRLIHVSVGVEESTDMRVGKLLQPYNSIRDRDFSIFLVDHNTSVLSSHVKNPGITFIYHPGLTENSAAEELDSDEYFGDEEFDFIHWLKETITEKDFVVLRINGRRVKYDILGDLFKAGAICHVDELFLHCSEAADCKATICGGCMSLFKSLRNMGVFVHQWLGD